VELELRQVLNIARRRAWMVILVMIVAGASAYVFASQQDKQYAASATLYVLPSQNSGSNEFSALQASRSLADTYRQLIETGPVMDRVISELDLPLEAPELNEKVSASIVGDTQLINVRVEDTSAERAAEIATTIVEQFQQYIDEGIDRRIEESRAGIDEQVAQIEDRRAEIVASIDDLENGENSDSDAVQAKIEQLRDELSRVEQSLTDLRVPALTVNTDIRAQSAPVEVADPARVPNEPFAPRPLFSTALGLFIGLLIGIALVALIEFLDNTVKPQHNVQAITGAPVLASVAQVTKLPPGAGQVYTMSQPRSSAAEALRLLRTNLEFASASGPISSLTITSPGPGEGKSTIAANLGVVMAQSDVQTVIVDADLRRPTQNRVFGVPNDKGLTTLLTHPDEEWKSVARKVALPGLWLIPSGPLPPNPSDLVSSDRFEKLLQKIQKDVDLIIVDSPPVLSASDSLSVAAHTDGAMLVIQSHKTRTDAVRHAASSIHQGGIRLVGVVINRQKGQQGASYYGEYYGADVQTRGASTAD
jgi:non-specific protein-tyrosine kinase